MPAEPLPRRSLNCWLFWVNSAVIELVLLSEPFLVSIVVPFFVVFTRLGMLGLAWLRPLPRALGSWSKCHSSDGGGVLVYSSIVYQRRSHRF